MIELKDVRVGNWLMLDNERVWSNKYNKTNQQVTIDTLNEISSNENYYSPITLTEDVLKKLGFWNKRQTNVDGLLEYTFLRSINMSKSYDILLTVINGEYRIYKEMKIVGICRFKHLHKFQNWFFFNTGIELEYS